MKTLLGSANSSPYVVSIMEKKHLSLIQSC